mmetsp:Transcript_14572/g.19031  ORF Transcript_14572/g.19031 Transcript_14572/m.19031 type:complete len:305 (-) Transcript_14572:158-1072(-)
MQQITTFSAPNKFFLATLRQEACSKLATTVTTTTRTTTTTATTTTTTTTTSLYSTEEKTTSSSTSSSADVPSTTGVDARRRVLLSRKGPHFAFNRGTGQIEFGATARLVTTLISDDDDDDGAPQPDLIAAWLNDEDSFAMSIWRRDLTSDMGNSVYRLQLMTLNFVSLELSPWVDLRMKTVQDSKGNPVFTLQSVGFDPNVKLGILKVSAEQLGIVIEVAGQLRATKDGKGVSGSIAFQTTGELPNGPLRLLPNSVLQAASDSINETIVKFAVQSFQTGAIANFKKYRQQQQNQPDDTALATAK